MKSAIKKLSSLTLAAALVCSSSAVLANPGSMRIAGNFSSNTKHVDNIERPFFGNFPKIIGIPMSINYNPMDTVGVQAADALRMLRSGTFDVMSVQIGMASRDDPFFEGVDLIGVSTVGSSRVDLQACKLEYSIVSPK